MIDEAVEVCYDLNVAYVLAQLQPHMGSQKSHLLVTALWRV
jgi:hypothetical protein